MPPPISRYHDPPPAPRGVDPGRTPQAVFEGVGTALVATRDERGAGGGDCCERGDRVMTAGNMRRIRARADHDEIVPGDLPAIDAVPLGDELSLGLRIVHQDQIGVAMRRRRQRLARTLGEDSHRDAGLLGEFGQDVREEARILDRGRRGERDRSSARLTPPASIAEPIRIAAASFPPTTAVLPWHRRQRLCYWRRC